MIDYILSIDTIEQQCVVIKVMLQSLRMKYHVQTIGIDQSLSNIAIYEQKCLENIKIYTNKVVRVMTSNNSNIFLVILWFLLLKDSPTKVLYIPLHQKPRARKSLFLFTNILEVKKTSYCRVGAAQYERKAIIFGNKPWALK